MNDKPSVRKLMSVRRRELNSSQQASAASGLARHLGKHPAFQSARHIAGYIASNGEIDPHPLLCMAVRLGKRVYLPVIAEDHLTFTRYIPGTTVFRRNDFLIPEPRWRGHSNRPPANLDLVLLPLLAFDPMGNRLGMGGGFYDRTFAFKRRRARASCPRLIGLAHSFQQVAELATDHWDIPLAGIATEQKLELFSAGR